MKNTINLNNLTCRLANLNSPFRRSEALRLIQQTAGEGGHLHVQHHLSVLDEAQRLDHLVWLAEYQGQYIGWMAVEVDVSEDDDEAFVSVAPYALYVCEEYRGSGVASELIQKAAFDSAFWAIQELQYRSLEYFQLMRGLEAEVLNLHLEIEARGGDSAEIYFIEQISRAMAYEFERQTRELPYFVHMEQETH